VGSGVMRGLLRFGTWVYIALFALFMLAPLFFVVLNSFNRARFSTFPPTGFSMQWYARLFTISDFWLAIRNSLIVAAGSTMLALVIGTAAALAVARGRWRNGTLLQSLMLTPLLVPKIVIGIAIFIAAIRIGLYPSYTSLALAHAILVLPYVISIVGANLHRVDRSQEEAATDLGANPLQTFRLATVPQIRRGLMLAALFGFILSFDELDVSLFLTRADNMTLPIRMYNYMQEFEDPTLAALSTLLIAVSIIVFALMAWIGRGMSLTQFIGRRSA
jgi:ABC-type spermidine/putrescine transport system permease subunit II